MYFATVTALVLSVAASVSAVAVPRATPPTGWLTAKLEPYDTYHTRYMALSCNTQHNTDFFDQCCHPLLVNQKLSSLPDECDPANDDLPFCDEIDDEPTSTVSVIKPTSTPTQPKTTATKVSTTIISSSKPTSSTTVKKVTTSTAAKAVATPPTNSAVETGGFATFFYQNGVAGACGTVHSDNDLIAAIDGNRYGNLDKVSSTCGRKVQITNTNNKKTVTVTIADACPTCTNSNSIDLSVGAFKKLATLDEGMVPITWEFV